MVFGGDDDAVVNEGGLGVEGIVEIVKGDRE